ncbi:hypothetical protein M1466_01575 [Candidatus Dependentiae bacterium]|nr:hypothetical protein [Candidatus Dependentiae bacterium]
MQINCQNFFLPLCIAIVISVAVPAEATWQDITTRIKNSRAAHAWNSMGQLPRSLLEMCTATAVNGIFGYSIAHTTDKDFFELRAAVAALLAPSIARNLQLTPKILQRLANHPRWRAVIAQLIKQGFCLSTAAIVGVVSNLYFNQEASDVTIQYFAAAILMLEEDFRQWSGFHTSETLFGSMMRQPLYHHDAADDDEHNTELILSTQAELSHVPRVRL